MCVILIPKQVIPMPKQVIPFPKQVILTHGVCLPCEKDLADECRAGLYSEVSASASETHSY